MKISDYSEFIGLVEKYKLIPFSDFIADHPSLTAAASECQWHTGLESDPWTWRIRIVSDGVSAYGKFFGDKAAFIHVSMFPLVKSLLQSGKTVRERFEDGQLSTNAYRIYNVIKELGNVDSRGLRKAANLDAKEQKKEYEKSLVELQNYGDIVITGSRESDNHSGWNSMCYELSDDWLQNSVLSSTSPCDMNQAKETVAAILNESSCSEKAFAYFSKKLKLA